MPEAAPSVLSCPPPVRFPTGVIEPLPPPAAVQAINTRTAVPTPPRVPVVTPTNVAAAGRGGGRGQRLPPTQQNAHLPPPPNNMTTPPANTNAAAGGGIVGLAPVAHDDTIEQIRRQNDGTIERMISAHLHKMQNTASALAKSQQTLARLQQERLLQQAAAQPPPAAASDAYYVGAGAGSRFVGTVALTAPVMAPAPANVSFHQQHMNMPPSSSIPTAIVNNNVSHMPPLPDARVAQQPLAPAIPAPVPVPAPYPNQICAAPSTSASSMTPPKFELTADIAKAAHFAKALAQPPICPMQQHPYASVAGSQPNPLAVQEVSVGNGLVQNQNCNILGLHLQQHLLQNQGGDPTLYQTQVHPSNLQVSLPQQMAPPANATGPKPESLLLIRTGMPVAAPTMDIHEAPAPANFFEIGQDSAMSDEAESPESKRYHVKKRPIPRPKNSYNFFFRHQSQKLKRRDLAMILMRRRLEIYRDKHRGKETDHLVSLQLLWPGQFNRTNHIAKLWGSEEYVLSDMRHRFEAMADCDQEHYRTVVQAWQAEETYTALEALVESSGLERDLLHKQIKESIENMD